MRRSESADVRLRLRLGPCAISMLQHQRLQPGGLEHSDEQMREPGTTDLSGQRDKERGDMPNPAYMPGEYAVRKRHPQMRRESPAGHADIHAGGLPVGDIPERTGNVYRDFGTIRLL